MPAGFVAAVYEAALKRPTLKDVAAHFEVSVDTLRKWFEENPHAQVAFDRAKSDAVMPVLDALEKKAKDGQVQAAEKFINAHRPDLVKPDAHVEVNLNQTTLQVLPRPQTPEQYRSRLANRPAAVIEGTATPLSDRLGLTKAATTSARATNTAPPPGNSEVDEFQRRLAEVRAERYGEDFDLEAHQAKIKEKRRQQMLKNAAKDKDT